MRGSPTLLPLLKLVSRVIWPPRTNFWMLDCCFGFHVVLIVRPKLRLMLHLAGLMIQDVGGVLPPLIIHAVLRYAHYITYNEKYVNILLHCGSNLYCDCSYSRTQYCCLSVLQALVLQSSHVTLPATHVT